MRNVIVTGGSRGLGLSMVQELAAAGYRVISVARKPSPELDAAARSVSAGAGASAGAGSGASAGAIEFRACDLSDLGQIGNLVRGVRKEFGPLYGLINNAGLGTSGMLSNML